MRRHPPTFPINKSAEFSILHLVFLSVLSAKIQISVVGCLGFFVVSKVTAFGIAEINVICKFLNNPLSNELVY